MMDHRGEKRLLYFLQQVEQRAPLLDQVTKYIHLLVVELWLQLEKKLEWSILLSVVAVAVEIMVVMMDLLVVEELVH
jgi:hypothetical protein